MTRLLGFLMLLGVPAAPATAQSVSYEARWVAVQGFMQDLGYDLSRSRFEVVSPGDTARQWVDFQAGSAYVVVALCGDRCRAVDLRMSDFYRQPVTPDVDFGDASIFMFTAARSDRYRLHAEPMGCDGASCIVGVAVFRRDGVVTAARRRR